MAAIAAASLVMAACGLVATASPAQASKGIVGWLGGADRGTRGGEFDNNAAGVAVNETGAGGVPAGTAYTTERRRVQRFDPSGEWVAAWGFDTIGINEQQVITIAATGGSYTLTFNGETTAPMSFDATPTIVEERLMALASIGPGNVDVIGCDTFCDNPFQRTVTFLGPLAGTDVGQLSADASGLSNTGAPASIAVTTTVTGAGGTFAGYEICTEAQLCNTGSQNPPTPAPNGGFSPAFDGARGIAVDQSDGSVFVYDRGWNRVQKFTATGEPILVFGKDVNQTLPGTGAEVCTVASEDVCKAGAAGELGGEFGGVGENGLAVVPEGLPNAGNVIVGDSVNERLMEFTGEGEFVRAVGWDVVKPGGAENLPRDEEQEVSITAVGGTFTLTFGNQTTAAIPFDAPASDPGTPGTVDSVEEALEALSNITDVQVTGGPGDSTGSSPYTIAFEGSTADQDVAQLVANGNALVTPVGHTRTCAGPTSVSAGGSLDKVEFQWLRNGAPIPGATEPAYTTTAADEGKVVQCQTFAFSSGGTGSTTSGSVPADTGSTQASVPFAVVGTAPPTAPPMPPATLPDPEMVFEPSTESMRVGEDGGAELVCATGSWSGSPSFTYQWYRDGVPLSGNGANTKTYTVQTADLAEPAVFQCAVTGTNAGGSVTKVSRIATSFSMPDTTPRPAALVADVAQLDSLALVSTPVPGANFEVCTVAEDCRPGTVGVEPGQFASNFPRQVAIDSSGAIYVAEQFGGFRVQKITPQAEAPGLAAAVFGSPGAPNGSENDNSPFSVAVTDDDSVLVPKRVLASETAACRTPSTSEEVRIQEFSPSGDLLDTHMACAGVGTAEPGVAYDPADGDIYLAARDRVYIVNEPIPPDLQVMEPSPTATSATVTGIIDPNSGGYPNAPHTRYQVEYKRSSESEWTPYLTPLDLGAGDAPVPFSTTIFPLLPNTEYDVRVVALKDFESVEVTSEEQSFTTLAAPPQISGFSTSNLRADSADLHAVINPRGSDTTYYFEYGPTADYGQVIPIQPQGIGGGHAGVEVTQHIEGLAATTYHFRVIAENEAGKVVSEDQTFDFYPPACPNQTVRQQTGSNYLPDCRAYEIASPENAGGTVLLTWSGPPVSQATSPSRVAFLAMFGGILGTGDPPGTGEMYVATRTTAGWNTRYVGLPAQEVFQSGALPTPINTDSLFASFRRVPTDPQMNRFVIWSWGYREPGLGVENPYISFAPYVLDASGAKVDRWLTDLPGYAGNERFSSTEAKASRDLGHLVFNSDKPLLPGALPGDIYDYDTEARTAEVVSRDPNGAPFEGSIVDVSSDGSHILMSSQRYEPCNDTIGINDYRCDPPVPPTEFYMRVDGVTHDVTKGHLGRFQDMSADGSKVYFLSDEQVTADDTDASTDLYVWSEAADAVTRVSAGVGGAGDTDLCNPVKGWAQKCSVGPISYFEQSEVEFALKSPEPEFFHAYHQVGQSAQRGNGISDGFVAARSGDIYFFSPEQLTGDEGVSNRANLFVYRNGAVQFVASFDADPICHETDPGSVFNEVICADGPIGRMQVSPNGRFAAFTTRSALAGVDTAGREMMYRYDAVERELLCVSCPLTGKPPAHDVQGSSNGLFMTDDGRVFFATRDAVVARDTNEGIDVYEFVDGRPQLITNGLSPEDEGTQFGTSPFIKEGLIGVTADGTDAYFATRETLTPQDRNGGNMKIYDARTNGGFPVDPPAQPCAAADECHAGSSLPPPPLRDASGADRGALGSNVRPSSCAKQLRRSRKATRRAKALRRKAKRARRGAARRLRRQGQRVMRRARKARQRAARCRDGGSAERRRSGR